MERAAAIRDRVLRGIALNRRPGFQFPGNFLDIAFDHIAPDCSRLSLQPGPWCADAGGQAHVGAVALLADLALAACVRAHLARETRLATVSMSLQFTGAPRTGQLDATGEFQDFFRDGAGRLGMSRVAVAGEGGLVCQGSGSFMALEPPRGVKLHPVPHRDRRSAEPEPLDEGALDADERRILARADAALAAEGDFLGNFWGIQPHHGKCALAVGPHIGNRVGHAQGGILIGLAAATASSALPSSFRLAGLSAWYISPGDAKTLRAGSTVIHQGRRTAVVRTRVTGKNRRAVLEVVTTHSALAREIRTSPDYADTPR